ncbi:hypothetical protein LPJ59_000714 [Coemansia sp. RSA 2399]|nr:hypothetical protein LPJ59_000714 [Coemansia sp. RSA 2399]KAJ1907724.1 hypothetical protein LPJ81_000577 [Coemansia sp. IMI 209127]
MAGGHCNKNPFAKDEESSSLPFPRVCGTDLVNPTTAWSSQSSVQTEPQQQQQPLQVNYVVNDGNIPTDLPPAYSFVDPNTRQQQQPPLPAHSEQGNAAPHAKNLFADVKLENRKPNELFVTKGYLFDRPLSILVDKRITTTMTAERDTNVHNTNVVYVRAEVSYSGSTIKDLVNVSDAVNARNEYELRIESLGSFWTNMWLSCKLTIVFPMLDKHVHPGLSVELSGGPVEMTYLDNIHFASIGMEFTKAKVLLTKVAADFVRVKTTTSSVTATNVTTTNVFHAQTSNSSIALTDVHSVDIVARTTNSGITLSNVTSRTGSIDASSSNGQINCNDVYAKDLQLRTTNSSIDAERVSADSLVMETQNSKITGSWNIEKLLKATTTNSRIEGVIALGCASLDTQIYLSTTNSSIVATLPANEFCGKFDCTTSNSNVNLKWKGQKLGKADVDCPVSLVVDDKSYKSGFVGPSKAGLQSFSARTTNSSVDIKFE